MAGTVQKAFRLPEDVAQVLEGQPNATNYVVAAIREKTQRDEEERFRASARRIASLPAEERNVDFALDAQSEAALEK